MSKSKREILDTEKMLERLTILLRDRAPPGAGADGYGGTARADAEALRRISMTLHRWHEAECGGDNGYSSYSIVRGRRVGKAFEYADDGAAYFEIHSHDSAKATYQRIPDRETGAKKRLAKIMARYPSLTAYIQTDPSGCALYILKPDDVPAGEDPSCYYSRGLAVYR